MMGKMSTGQKLTLFMYGAAAFSGLVGSKKLKSWDDEPGDSLIPQLPAERDYPIIHNYHPNSRVSLSWGELYDISQRKPDLVEGQRIYNHAISVINDPNQNDDAKLGALKYFDYLVDEYAVQARSLDPFKFKMPFEGEKYYLDLRCGSTVELKDTEIMLTAYQMAKHHAASITKYGPQNLYGHAHEIRDLYQGRPSGHDMLGRLMDNMATYLSEMIMQNTIMKFPHVRLPVHDRVRELSNDAIQDFFNDMSDVKYVETDAGRYIPIMGQASELISLVLRQAYKDYFKRYPLPKPKAQEPSDTSFIDMYEYVMTPVRAMVGGYLFGRFLFKWAAGEYAQAPRVHAHLIIRPRPENRRHRH